MITLNKFHILEGTKMLSQFSVHSYRSYRSQALISMQPANIDEHAAALRDPRKTGRPLLPVAAIDVYKRQPSAPA